MWYDKKDEKCLLNLEQSDIENNNFEKQMNVEVRSRDGHTSGL